MKRKLLSLKQYFLFLLVTLNVLFTFDYVNGATYYSRGSLAPNLTTSWAVNTNGTGSQPSNFTTSGDIFTIQNGHSMTMSADWAVTGNVVINNGGIITTSNRTITISGTTTIGSGSSGTININSSSGSKNFYGLVTINSGATWNNSANEAVTFRGGIVNNGTFTAGTGTHTFNTNAQTISATISIPSVTVTGITLTNNGNLTVGAALAGTGGLINSAAGVLNIGGTLSITTLTATAAGNTVNYYRSGNQTAKVTTYSNLTISGSGIKTFATNPTVEGILSMEGTTASIAVTTGAVTYGPDAKLQYNKTAAYTATTEEWPATFSGTGGVQIVNTGVITFGAEKTITNTLSIAAGSSINLGTFTTHIAGSLTFGGNPQLCGTWGSTTAASTYHNNSYFAATSGYIWVGSVPAAPTGVLPGSGVAICIGSGTNLNATSAGNTINWYTVPTGGTSIGSSASGANFFVSPISTTTYYAETQTPGGCVSTSRTATATITVNSQISNNILDILNGTHFSVCATANENTNAVITAPAGKVFVSVDFASYGTPTGICQSFAIGGCNAVTSNSICEGYLLGKSTASIPATNAVFTDPCVGTLKRLYIQASYNCTMFEICEGNSPGTISGIQPDGGDGTYTYLWESSTINASSGFVPASGINNSRDYTPGTLTQTTWFRRTVTSGGCSNTSDAVEVTVNPTISINNTGAQIACDSYNLPAITGTNLSGNQKYYNNSQALGGIVITGPLTTSQTVWIYDSDGTCNDEESFTVTIISRPSVSSISTPSSLCAGNSLNPSNPAVTPNGSAITEQGWQIETTAGSGTFTGIILPYITSDTDNGKKFRYYATNTCGSTNSNEVILSVTALPVITTQPSPLNLCDGESGNFNIETSAASPFYQWQYSGSATGPWTITDGLADVSGHTSNQLSLINVPLSYNNFYVSCVVTSNSCSSQSDAVLLKVNSLPATGEIIPD